MKKDVKTPNENSKITRDPFPGSEKIYVAGSIHPNVKVAMRQINLSNSKAMFTRGEFVKDKNQPVVVYDTSGPFTDPAIEIDVKKGIPAIRQQWIEERGDVEKLNEISSDFGKERLYNSDLDHLRFEHLKKPLVAKKAIMSLKCIMPKRNHYA